MACGDIKAKLDDLLEVRREIIVQLHTERDQTKRAELIWELKAVGPSIAFQQRKLEKCLEEETGVSPLTTRFNATRVLTTTHPDARGPYEGDIVIGIRFNASRTEVTITSFPDIVSDPSDTPVGDNVTTVSLISGGNGTFDKSTGHIGIALGLRFDHSNRFIGDSTLSLMLTTHNVEELQGSPLNNTTRALTMVGRGTLNGGYLNGSDADLIVSGGLETLP